MIEEFDKDNVRVLTYLNPMLTQVEGEKNNFKRNLFKEARDKGYMIHNKKTKQLFYTKAFSHYTAGLLDITNPDAVEWYKQLIKNILDDTKVYGFMSDFGEAAPISAANATLYDSNMDLMEFHNTYPVLWNQLVGAAVKEYIQERNLKSDEIVYFTRSGYTNSPNYTRLLWAGDQNLNYGRHNGIRSGLVAMLSGGFSGYTMTHTDIGGYTYIQPIFGVYNPTRRDKDLIIRWLELGAFSPVFRSHEGNLPSAAR